MPTHATNPRRTNATNRRILVHKSVDTSILFISNASKSDSGFYNFSVIDSGFVSSTAMRDGFSWTNRTVKNQSLRNSVTNSVIAASENSNKCSGRRCSFGATKCSYSRTYTEFSIIGMGTS